MGKGGYAKQSQLAHSQRNASLEGTGRPADVTYLRWAGEENASSLVSWPPSGKC